MVMELTRRRALALGASAGLGALVRFPEAAAAGTRSFVLDVPRAAWARGGGRATGTLKAPRRFDLLGVRGRGLDHVEVRVRRAGGAWSPWTPFGAGTDHAPDAPRVPGATDPVWAGGSEELQLRARKAPRGLRVHFVSVPRTRPAAGLRAVGRAAQNGPPTIITRTQWGGDTIAPRSKPSYGDVQMAFVHHTVSANGYAASDSQAIVLAIAKYHRDTNGWSDLGYNLLVDQFGQVFEGRAGGIDQAVVGAQAQGWNSHSTGIATIGTFSDVAFPEAGMAALARVIAYKLGLHGVPATGTVQIKSAGGAANRYAEGRLIGFERISGHRDGCQTSCPGNALYAQLPELRARVARLGGATAAKPKLTLAPGAVLVAYGQTATFAGTLRDGDGSPVAGTPIELQKQGSNAFVTVARATTRADGTWTTSLPWRRGAAVRAVGAGVRSTPVSVAVETVLELAPTPKRVLAGRSAVVTGKVRPAGGVRLRVERQTARGWTKVADVPATVRSGRFRAKALLRRPGVYRLTLTAKGAAPGAPVYVRAVRNARDVTKATGGAAPTAPAPAPPSLGGGAIAG